MSENLEEDKRKTGKAYFIFNTVFTVLQLALLICAGIVEWMQEGRGQGNIVSYFALIIITQLFCAECIGSVLGGLSYIKKLRNVMVWFDLVGLAAAAVLMVWSWIWGVLGGIEGAPFPKAFYVAVPSLMLLLVKTIADGAVSISSIVQRKRLKREG